jgi:hypothetical protein
MILELSGEETDRPGVYVVTRSHWRVGAEIRR